MGKTELQLVGEGNPWHPFIHLRQPTNPLKAIPLIIMEQLAQTARLRCVIFRSEFLQSYCAFALMFGPITNGI